MSIFSTLFSKSDPKTVTAHILDPIKGYITQQWVIGRDVFPPSGANLAAEKDIYVINTYEAGKVKPTICQKSIWLLAKSTYATMDEVGADAMSKTEAMFKNLS
jgi:hypothetical protein